MTRYERRVFFEKLIDLRTAYAAAGDGDRTATISIDDAIAEAEAALEALGAMDEPTPVDEPGTVR